MKCRCFSRPARTAAWLAISLAAVLGTGCGWGERGTLEGRVTRDGKPLELGAISLEPLPGVAGQVTGGLVQGGAYALSGKAAARPGRYKVRITASPRATGRMVVDPTRPPGSGLAPELLDGDVAARYNDQTMLEVEISAGKNVADFAVESK
jgi:hypothetical protein